MTARFSQWRVRGNATSPRNWAIQDYLGISRKTTSTAALISAETEIHGTAATTNNDTSFLLDATPPWFVSMSSLTLYLNCLTQSVTDDTANVYARIVNGSTILAAGNSGGSFQQVMTGIGAISRGIRVITFLYVNTGASKADWDGAQIELRQVYSTSMSSDGGFAVVTALWLDATYNEASPATGPFMVRDEMFATNATSETSTTVTINSTIPVNDYLIARIGADNSGTSGAAPTLSITDSGGNTWTVLGPALADPGAANDGTCCWLAYAKITTQLVNGNTVTLTWGTATVGKAVQIEQWHGLDLTNPIDQTAVTDTGVENEATNLPRTPSAVGAVYIGAYSLEWGSMRVPVVDAGSFEGVWMRSPMVDNTDGGGDHATNSVTIRGVSKLVTGTSAQNWQETPITIGIGIDADWAAIAAVFKAAPQATPSLPPYVLGWPRQLKPLLGR